MTTEQREYKFHPVAGVFPMLMVDDFEDLKKHIRKHGLLEPIVLHKGRIIDGRNRYKACRELNIEPKFREWGDEEGSLVEYVLGLNLHRRSLTASQRAAVAHDVLPLLKEEAEKRQKAGLKQNALPADSVTQKIEERLTDKEIRIEAAEQAARLSGTNRQYIYDLQKIKREDPKLFKAVKDGKKTISQAKRDLAETAALKKESAEETVDSAATPSRDMKKEPFSTARQFSTIAISQLTRIKSEDHKRNEALLEVLNYVVEQIGDTSLLPAVIESLQGRLSS